MSPSIPVQHRQHAVTRNAVVSVTAPGASAYFLPHATQAITARNQQMRVLVPASPEKLGSPLEIDNSLCRIYTVRGNDTIMGRYRVRAGIGFGSSGTVVRAEDQITGTLVAIKVFHRNSNIDAKHEGRMYKKIIAGCNPHISLFAQVVCSGTHEGFHCVVFELCHTTLYDALQPFAGLVPLPMRHVAEIAYQLVCAVEYLHSLGIVHTDIKLDNIGLRFQDTVRVRWLDPAGGFEEKKLLSSTQICLLDLGSAVELQGRGVCHGRAGTRGYRAPELALGVPWNRAVDNFSIGCVIAEMYLAHSLFDPDIDSDREYLATVDRLLGPYPRAYAEGIESKYSGTFILVNNVAIQYPPEGAVTTGVEFANSMRRLERVRPLSARIHDPVLYDLLYKLMAPSPLDRITLAATKKHDFFDRLTKVQWA
ncbi:kinase-like protein [Lenzites betulinus]|nr:kinase-like protein [Lenzites betulinus]